jgi:hypothetical protein
MAVESAPPETAAKNTEPADQGARAADKEDSKEFIACPDQPGSSLSLEK